MTSSCPSCFLPLSTPACPACGWAPPPPRIVWSLDQLAALEVLDGPENVYLGGAAGCVDGEAEIRYSRAGLGRKILLKDLYLKFNGIYPPTAVGEVRKVRWKSSIPTYVRSLVNGIFRLNLITAVLDQGVKPVVKVTLASGKTLRVTPDHEVCVAPEQFMRADALQPGDEVLTNGRPVAVEACTSCGGTDRIALVQRYGKKQNKYPGLCRPCIDQILCDQAMPSSSTVDKRGYLYWTVPRHPSRAFTQKRVFEHRLVVEASMNGVTLEEWLRLGRSKGGYPEGSKFLTRSQVVHHRNGDVKDNRLENLEVTTPSEHGKEHGRDGGFLHMDGGTAGTGGKIQFAPKVDRVVSVVSDGETHVYDIVCADPWRNFVANGIVVHNCGKSTLLKHWLAHGRPARERLKVAVTASTGIAAMQIGGRTLHAWSGAGLGKESAHVIADNPRWGWRYRAAQRIRSTDVLVLEEASLVDGRTFSLVSDLCKIARGPDGVPASSVWRSSEARQKAEERGRLPFGGIKLVLLGDMGQLAPVEEATGYPFETEEWWDAKIRTVELTTVHRQSDRAWVSVLREVRDGKLSPEGKAMLASRVRAFDPDADPPAARVTTHNRNADAVNERRLAQLAAPAFSYLAEECGDPRVLETLDKECLSPRELVLKVGARVMFTRNEPSSSDDVQGRYVNGTLGTVTWTDPEAFEVTTDQGLVICPQRAAWQKGGEGGDVYRPEKWTKRLVKVREAEKGEAARLQFPVKLAWSVTIHKCVHPRTLVETDRGLCRMGDVQPGKVGTVGGLRDHAGVVSNPEDDGVRIRTKRGYEIEASLEHAFMASRFDDEPWERMEACQFKLGDTLRLKVGSDCDPHGDLRFHPAPEDGDVRERKFKVPEVLTEDVAEFLGLMVGDGTVFPAGFRLSKRHADVVIRFSELVFRIFGVQAKHHARRGFTFAEVCSRWLVRWLRGIDGIQPKCKAVPAIILRAPKSMQRAFLRGLFEDGSAHLKEGTSTTFDHAEWSTRYEEMSRDVQVMLLRLGIVSSRFRRDHTLGGEEVFPSWRVAIYGEDAVLFRQTINFISEFKRSRMALASGEGRGWRTLQEGEDLFYDQVVALEAVRMPSACVRVPGHGRFVQGGFDGFNCQGMTLDRVSVDLQECFAAGQAYVALSRCRTLEGLNVERWSGEASILTHPSALRFLRGEYRPPDAYYEARGLPVPGAAPAVVAPPTDDFCDSCGVRPRVGAMKECERCLEGHPDHARVRPGQVDWSEDERNPF